ncbi:BTAD domain-containing putative transcriptional regulator [Actinomadura sp. 1N219]|uniref:AfsR/SARP family transcriptional regulator n=1 Tax=Actinomadura sp. 1N219 TaxID=3375152 RepID=UPI003799E898
MASSELIDWTWGESTPTYAGNLIQKYISGLRKSLSAAALETTTAGYILRVPHDHLDLTIFENFLTTAGKARAAGESRKAAVALKKALDLYRGPFCMGLTSPLLDGQRELLGERRLVALEDYLEVRLDLGEHAALLADLKALVAQHPLRERLRAAHMLALYRSGRQAEALAVYRDTHRLLAAELGVDPSPGLQELHQHILRRDASLAPPAPPPAPPAMARVTPAQLPGDIPSFVGRTAELDRLDAMTAGVDRRTGGMPICVISGPPGVGKSALAVRWAHSLVGRFPDGQLYVNLRAHDRHREPVDTAEVLSRFLRVLGVAPQEIPSDIDLQVGLFRSLLAGQRMLIVLDDASSAEQIQPLLPGGRDCLALVTSRNRLAGLSVRYGAERLALDVLSEDDSLALLRKLVGPDRVSAEPLAAKELARRCARLPLALCIVAANADHHPTTTLSTLAQELAGNGRLAALSVSGDEQAAVKATIDLSYRNLSAEAKRVFRLLGIAPGADFSAATVSALIERTEAVTELAMDELTAAHLVNWKGPRRYFLHDLLRAYAADRANKEDRPEEHRAALGRLFESHTRSALAAARVHRFPVAAQESADSEQVGRGEAPSDPSRNGPHFVDQADAFAWFEGERANLFAAIQSAAHCDPPSAAWNLADAVRGFCWLRPEGFEWLEASLIGLRAAKGHSGDKAQTAMNLCVADAHAGLGHDAEARDHYGAAIAAAASSGDDEHEAAALYGRGLLHWTAGRLAAANRDFAEALAVRRRAGDDYGVAMVYLGIGRLEHDRGRLQVSIDVWNKALNVVRDARSVFPQALILNHLSVGYRDLGRPDDAMEHLVEAMTSSRQAGFVPGVALALSGLSGAYADAGEDSKALETACEARTLISESGDRRIAAECLNTIAETFVSLDRLDDARSCFDRALTISMMVGFRRGECFARAGLASVLMKDGRCREALDQCRRALSLARSAGYRLMEGRLIGLMGDVFLNSERPLEAMNHYRHALALRRDMEYRRGAERLEQGLRRLERAKGEPVVHRC